MELFFTNLLQWHASLSSEGKFALWGLLLTLLGVIFTIKSYFKKNSSHSSQTFNQNGNANVAVNNGLITQNINNGVSEETTNLLAELLLKNNKNLEKEKDTNLVLENELKDAITNLDLLSKSSDESNSFKCRSKEALKLIESGDTQSAEDIFLEIENRSIKKIATEFKQAASAARYRGALAYLHDTDKALNAFRKAVKYDPENMEGWNLLAKILLRIGNIPEAEKSLENLLRLALIQGNREAESAAYSNLGTIYLHSGKPNEAENMHLKSMTINETLDDQISLACNFTNLGIIYKNRGELDDAEAMQLDAIAIYESLGNMRGISSNYLNLGVIYKIKNTPDLLNKAKKLHLKGISISEALKDREQISAHTGNLGMILQALGDIERAKECYEKSLSINKELNNKIGVANQLGNLGFLYIDLNDKKGVDFIVEAISICKSIGYTQGLASCYINLGVFYFRNNDLDKAFEAYEDSVEINQRIGNQEGLSIAFSNLGLIHKKRGELDKATAMFQKSLFIAKEIGLNQHALTVNKFISEI